MTYAKKILGLAFGAASLAVLASPANAGPISGTLDMAGIFNPVGGTLATATGVDFSGGSPTGSFIFVNSTGDILAAGIDGSGETNTIKDFTFNPFAGPILGFYTITDGGTVLSFDLETLSIDEQDADSLVLTGKGTMSLTGFDPTPGVWVFSGQTANGVNFSWSASSAATVPAPAALGLLGLGLLGIAAAARRRKA